MKWADFLDRFAAAPLVEPAMVYAGQENPKAIQAQLSRWVQMGRLVKLARGKYVLAKTYRKVDPPLESIACRLVYPSYVSLERALAWYGLIPESVPVVTSITTGRPRIIDNCLGTFRYRHIQSRLFRGYEAIELQGDTCMMALPEKAVLDMLYFHRGVATQAWLGGMRFQNLDRLDADRLDSLARETAMSKLVESSGLFLEHRDQVLREYKLT